MDFKKGEKSLFVPTMAILAGVLVIENIAKAICETVEKVHK